MPALRFVAVSFLGIILASPAIGQQPPKVDPLANANVEKDLPYGTHERNKLDLAVPKTGKGPFPLIVWIHGGGWEGGNKYGIGPLRDQLAKGYAVASINYRLSQHAVFPAQLLDAKSAIRYLRLNAKKYDLDVDHICVSGASAGGHLSALVGTSNGVKGLEPEGSKPEETRVHAVVDFFGPADLLKLSPPGAPDNPVTRLLGGDSGAKKSLAQSGTPQFHADQSDPPFLIIHGDADQLVPLSQSQDLHAALKKAGVKSDFVTVKGGGHGVNIFNKEISDKVSSFLETNLKKKSN